MNATTQIYGHLVSEALHLRISAQTGTRLAFLDNFPFKYRKMFFVLSRAWDKEKILSPYEESNLRPLDSRSDALPLSHRDSTVSEVYYEVHTRRVLHTARISNVDSVMFVDRSERDGKF